MEFELIIMIVIFTLAAIKIISINKKTPDELADNLMLITSEMAYCNHFSILPLEQWPDLLPEFKIYELRDQANKLPRSKWMTFVDGEEAEAAALANKYECHELHLFLNLVFDGYLHDQLTYR